ncbi:MAG: nitroreductase [Anaerolineales bacterium]|nr:nitroreductase [Anaerolineales bacterium]
MNATIEVILNRKSVRAYEDKPIPVEVRDMILHAAMRAPTAGNMMLYSIIEVRDQAAKNRLVETCDHQPFIAEAPLVLLFLADYQRWYDYFLTSGVDQICEREGVPMLRPEEGDLFLACCDVLIAAQTAVIAAESLGLGSCYIGDILENYEIHKHMFDLPRYVLPICLLCFGYPTQEQKDRERTKRFDRQFIVFEDRYKRLGEDGFEEMMRDRGVAGASGVGGRPDFGVQMYERKFSADFAKEMRRSVRVMLSAWSQ